MDEMSPYLYSLAMRAATHFGSGAQASITVRHHGALIRAASSDDRSARCDQIEALSEDGPCVEALDQSQGVLVPDLAGETRWADWRSQALTQGFTSALAVPARVGPGMDVALNMYFDAGSWDHERALSDAETYARRIAEAVGLRVHFSTAQTPQTYAQLTGQEVVTRAVDAVMACNGCGHDEALNILASASSSRNVGLDDVAATVLLALTGVAVTATPHAGVDDHDRAVHGHNRR